MNRFPTLNFPDFHHKLKEENGLTSIWEPVRQSWLVLTPEEWVRQNLIRYLMEEMKYPVGLMQAESQVKVGKLKKRFDLVVMDKQLKPWLICECKAHDIKINKEAAFQAANYNMTLQCPFLVLTNGLSHYCYQINFIEKTFHPLPGFPEYPAD